MRRLTPLIAAVAAALALAAPASAATPLNIGTGVTPRVAMDQTGTAYLAWQSPAAISFCRLPRNARACDVRVDIPYEYESSSSNPMYLIRRADGVLALVLSTIRNGFPGDTLLLVSADGGASWTGPTTIATGAYDFSSAALTADGASLMTASGGITELTFQQTPLSGGETRTLELGDGMIEDPEITTMPDGRPLLVWYHSGEGIGWRVFGGGDPFDLNAWGALHLEPSSGDQPRLAVGPRGVFMLYQRSVGTQNLPPYPEAWAIRAFDTKRLRWRKPRFAAGDRFMYGAPDLAQDGGGRLHIASATSGGPSTYGCVVYTRTGRKSSQWFGPTTVLFRTKVPQRLPIVARLAVAPDGKGIAVWRDKEDMLWVTALKQKKGRAHTIKTFRKPNCEKL